MAGIKDGLAGFDRVTLMINYFIPKAEACSAVTEDPPRLLKTAHTGILQQFSHQIDDQRESNRQAFERLRFISNPFNQAVQEMMSDFCRVRLYFSNPEKSIHQVCSIGVLQADGCERLIELPEEMDSDLSLKAMIPYERARGFLKFWEDKIVAPLHSVQCGAVPLLTQEDIRIRREYSLN